METTQEKIDKKYIKRNGHFECAVCSSEIMAINVKKTIPVWEWPEQCAGSGRVEVITKQLPYCPKCDKDPVPPDGWRY